jgi:aldehyde:ferredoxin oxidoreductase
VGKAKRPEPKVVKAKKSCCKSSPRCKRCPVVCKRLVKAGAAVKRDDGRYELSVTLRKKQLTAARAR